MQITGWGLCIITIVSWSTHIYGAPITWLNCFRPREETTLTDFWHALLSAITPNSPKMVNYDSADRNTTSDRWTSRSLVSDDKLVFGSTQGNCDSAASTADSRRLTSRRTTTSSSRFADLKIKICKCSDNSDLQWKDSVRRNECNKCPGGSLCVSARISKKSP